MSPGKDLYGPISLMLPLMEGSVLLIMVHGDLHFYPHWSDLMSNVSKLLDSYQKYL